MMDLETQFNEQGFLVFEKAIDAGSLNSIREAAKRIVDDFDVNQHKSIFSTADRDRGRDLYFMESSEAVHCFLEEDALDEQGTLQRPKESAINKIGHAMHDLIPAFRHFCRQVIFAETLDAIGYQAPQLWQTMYIFKQARIGGEVRWHQDASYLITEPPSVVGFWIAVEDANRDNGCLWVQPGGHCSPLRERYEVDHESGKSHLRRLDDTPWPSVNEALAVEVEAGSLVIFNDHMPHYSSRNLSQRTRHAFTMHFAEAGSAWSKYNWLQRNGLGEFRI